MIKVNEKYVQSVAPDASYPQGGSFKNATTSAGADGTPLERQWANDIYGFFEAALAAGGVVASGVPDTATSSDVLTALRNLMWSPGDVKACAYGAPATGWLECNGGTIGNAASGASARANADTAKLFAVMWALSSMTIYTSAGAVTVRGANAAADFAANRRIAILDLRANGIRGWDHGRNIDTGRTLGSEQDWSTAAPKTTAPKTVMGDGSTSDVFHQGPGGSTVLDANPSAVAFVRSSKAGENVTLSGSDSMRAGSGEIDLYNAVLGDKETRGRNTALMMVIKL